MDDEYVSPQTGHPIRPPQKLIEQGSVPWRVLHRLRWFPAHPCQITLADIGAWTRRWEEVRDCSTCEGTGRIQKDRPFHVYPWARSQGGACQSCNASGKVLRKYEDRVPLNLSRLNKRRDLVGEDHEGITHAMSWNGMKRSSRCGLLKNVPVTLLATHPRVTCFMCLGWML